jgi:hypothetical protein
MMGDVISESAPSKWAALGTSVVPGHTQTWASSQQLGEWSANNACIVRPEQYFPQVELRRPPQQPFLAYYLLPHLRTFICLTIIERIANRDTIQLNSILVKIQKCRLCGEAATFVHSVATSYIPLKDFPKPKGGKSHPNDPNRSVSSNNIPHTRQVLFPTGSKQ